MPATPSLSLCPSLDGLPDDSAAIFAAAGREDFALGSEWFGNLIGNGLPAAAAPCFAVLSRGLATLAILPLQRHRDGRLASLTNCYSCFYAPLLGAAAAPAETARLLGRALGLHCLNRPPLRLDALPADWPGLDAFAAGLCEAGMPVRRFAAFGNWQERVAGRSWPHYLAARPGLLREVLRRKTKRAARNGPIGFEIVREPGDLPRGIAAFEAVYARSWKPPEPFPGFNAGLMRAAAALGALRLGLLSVSNRPVAAQLWIVWSGRATVMKLAHDPAHDELSPGTLLTARMVEALIGEGVEAIDFGRGDDPYKRLWAGERRQRIGLICANPRRLRGLMTLVRHDAGVVSRPLRARLGAVFTGAADAGADPGGGPLRGRPGSS